LIKMKSINLVFQKIATFQVSMCLQILFGFIFPTLMFPPPYEICSCTRFHDEEQDRRVLA
jgi:hypothetical protein